MANLRLKVFFIPNFLIKQSAFCSFIVAISIFVFSVEIEAQKYTLIIEGIDNEQLPLRLKNRYSFNDSTAVLNFLDETIFRLKNKGFLSASLDTICEENNEISAKIFFGRKYFWNDLHIDSSEYKAFSKAGIKTRHYKKRPLTTNSINKLQTKIINYYENNGYPFVETNFCSPQFEENKFTAKLSITKNAKIHINSFVFPENFNKHSQIFVLKYLNLKTGEPYNELKIKQIDNNISAIDFLTQLSPTSVEFTTDSAKVYLLLKKRNANRFSGILGVLPNEHTSGKLLITGEISLLLQNILNRAEKFDFQWKKLKSESQELSLKSSLPFIFRSQLGISAAIEMQKIDSSYLNLSITGGANIFINSHSSVSALVNKTSSNLLREIPQTSAFKNTATIMYGLKFIYNRYNNLNFPSQGFCVDIQAYTGTKTIIEEEKSQQTTHEFMFDFFMPITGKIIFRVREVSGGIFNKSAIYENELLQIGGNKILRGFDEKSIFCSLYSVSTFEMRYHFEQYSAVYFFYDKAFYKKESVSGKTSDRPYGFGVGLDFETRAGIFSLNYALGSQQGNKIEFRSAKIHFGYINRF